MEDLDQDTTDDTQRVSILSTLESSRRAAKRAAPAASGSAPRPRRRWPLALGALGLLFGAGMLWAFTLVLQDRMATPQPEGAQAMAEAARATAGASAVGHRPAPAAAPTAPAPQAALASNTDPLAALRATEASQPSASAAQALPSEASGHASEAAPGSSPAIIETVATKPTDLLPAAKSSPSSAAASAVKPSLPRPATPSPVATPGKTTPAKEGALRGREPAPASGERAATSSTKDDDVALLEAMFAHTGGRRGAASVQDELKRCAGLESQAAQTCRDKICRQNPKAPACTPGP